MTPRPPTLVRDRLTWLVYVLYGFYGALINGLGPALSGLRMDLGLTHTEASMHSSLFAVGMLVAGLGGDRLVRLVGRKGALWTAALGMTAGTIVIVLGSALPVTLLGALLAGTAGSLMLVLVPAILSDRHGPQRSAAFNEVNSIASGMAVLMPMLIGLSILVGLGWRPGLLAAAIFVVPVLAIGLRGLAVPEPLPLTAGRRGGLAPAYWAYWATIVLVVSVEFCMIYWTIDFFRTSFGFEPGVAAGALTLFLVGMFAGRATGARLLLRATPGQLLPVGLLFTAASFSIFWLSPWTTLSLAGVLLTGLGVATLYPMTLSLAVATALGTTDLATSRAALASGSAVLGGPLLLAALADALGIQVAFAIVPVLLVAAGGTAALGRHLEVVAAGARLGRSWMR